MAALTAAPSSAATPAPAAAPHFGGYVSCRSAGQHPNSTCGLSDRPVAVFRVFGKHRVAYNVCVRRPSGALKCRRKQSGHYGGRSRAEIPLTQPGRYKATWRVHGKVVARRSFKALAPRMFVDGDSLAVGTAPYLPEALSGWPITQSASISRQAEDGVSLLRAQGPRLAKVIFIGLGTNGDPRFTDSFRSTVLRSLAIAGPRRCVIWATIYRPGVAGPGYDGYNHILAKLNRRFENLMVVDWASLASHHPEWFGSERVHPDATGYEARARAIAEKARACVAGPLAHNG